MNDVRKNHSSTAVLAIIWVTCESIGKRDFSGVWGAETSGPINMKFGMGDYVGDDTLHFKGHKIGPVGAAPHIAEMFTLPFLFSFFLFFNSPTVKTAQRI